MVRPPSDYFVMECQQQDRRETGRALRPGDLVQAQIGGEIREVVWVQDAGDVIEREALRRPRVTWGADERCAMFAVTRRRETWKA